MNISKKAYELWIYYNKPINKDLDIWLEAEKICYNETYDSSIIHKGKDAFFRVNEKNNDLVVLLCPYRNTINYRINDILLLPGNNLKYYNYILIKVKDIDYNGKILNYEWMYGVSNSNFNYNKLRDNTEKFGNCTGESIYIGRQNRYNKEIVKSFNFYCNNEIWEKNHNYNIPDKWD